MITGSLAAVAHKIDRITKRKSDIVLLLSERRQAQRVLGARASFATLRAVYAVRCCHAKSNQVVLQGLPALQLGPYLHGSRQLRFARGPVVLIFWDVLDSRKYSIAHFQELMIFLIRQK
jgi:hypothetical protein